MRRKHWFKPWFYPDWTTRTRCSPVFRRNRFWDCRESKTLLPGWFPEQGGLILFPSNSKPCVGCQSTSVLALSVWCLPLIACMDMPLHICHPWSSGTTHHDPSDRRLLITWLFHRGNLGSMARANSRECVWSSGTICQITSRKRQSWRILKLCWNPIYSVIFINDPNGTYSLSDSA